jgi:hypothetical protein
MKKARIVLLLSLLPVLALVVYVAYAATVICPAGGAALLRARQSMPIPYSRMRAVPAI